MRLGIFAKTFPGTTPAAVIAAARAAGFSAVQYNMACSGLASMPDAIPAGTAEAVSRAGRDARVEISAVSGTYNMIHPDPAVRARGLARLEVLAAGCAGLDTSLITLCTGTRDRDDQWRAHRDNDTPEAWRDLLTEMAKAIAIADRHDVDLGIEPELANVINSAPKARQLIDELQSPRLKIVLDPANLFDVEPLENQRDIVSAAIDLLDDRIVMGHAKDRTATGAFTAAGQGVLDFAHYVGRLKAIGFDRSLVTHGLDAHEAAAVAVFLTRVLTEQGVEVVP
jgi:sugar phosphate isomerase/epimerase